MPPKAKFSREEIIQSALDLVRTESIDALTSRALGLKLGSSARPVFTVFQNMEEVQQAVTGAAKTLYREYVQKGLCDTPPFKGVGRQYILFAVNEPKLFQLLFMREHKEVPALSEVLPLIDESYEEILSSIQDSYDVKRSAAAKLYRHLWIYTHGIATLCATHMCHFTGEEISVMMSEVFAGVLKSIKAGKENDPD